MRRRVLLCIGIGPLAGLAALVALLLAIAVIVVGAGSPPSGCGGDRVVKDSLRDPGASGATALSDNQLQFVARLAADTGLDPHVVAAWVLAEEPAGAQVPVGHIGDQNWLNIGNTDSRWYAAGASVWSTPIAAADTSAAWLRGRDAVPGFGPASAGVRRILTTAGEDPAAQVRAIQTSGWASSGYPDLPHIYERVAATSLPTRAIEPDVSGEIQCPPCPAAMETANETGVPNEQGGFGFTPAAGTNYTIGQEPELARRLDALGRALHLPLTGLSGYRTPHHSVDVGGFANDPHTRGMASDTPGIEAVPETTLNQYGLTRPFRAAAEADHIQLLPGIESPSVNAGRVTSEEGACQSVAGTTPGARARINEDGTALAPAAAPRAVQAMVAAGNRIHTEPYVYGGGHGSTLDALSPDHYDCSSAISYLLHAGGVLGTSALDSKSLERWGAPGPGRWVTVYANSGHSYMKLGGIFMNTAWWGAVSPMKPHGGPRWQTIGKTADSFGTFTLRHPPGL